MSFPTVIISFWISNIITSLFKCISLHFLIQVLSLIISNVNLDNSSWIFMVPSSLDDVSAMDDDLLYYDGCKLSVLLFGFSLLVTESCAILLSK